MNFILSSLFDLARNVLSGPGLWPALAGAVVALTMTLTGLTARIAAWVHDRLAQGAERAPEFQL
jgi:hypothetical protein